MKTLIAWGLRLAYRLLRLKWWITRPLSVGVRMILIEHERVLLVRHTYQQHWYFPGGAVERGELLLDAAMREAREEAGITFLVEPTLFGVYTSFAESKSDHIATFCCTEFQVGERPDRWEIEDCRFFPLAALPADLSPACARRLAEYQAGQGPYAAEW